jgi:hypothetical protein
MVSWEGPWLYLLADIIKREEKQRRLRKKSFKPFFFQFFLFFALGINILILIKGSK